MKLILKVTIKKLALYENITILMRNNNTKK